MGTVRHVADIRADDMTQDGQGVVILQSGKYKSQQFNSSVSCLPSPELLVSL